MSIKIFERSLKDFRIEVDKGVATLNKLKVPFFQRQYRWDEKNWEVSTDSIEDIANG